MEETKSELRFRISDLGLLVAFDQFRHDVDDGSPSPDRTDQDALAFAARRPQFAQVREFASNVKYCTETPTLHLHSPPTEYSSRSQQSPHNPSLIPVPFSLWIGSIGRAKDVDAGWSIRGISSGLGHTLISYAADGTDRVFACGRNEVGQLGVGFNSQEATRNLVEGFTGDSIGQVAASVQSSYLLLNNHGEQLCSTLSFCRRELTSAPSDSTSLYVAGSLQRGRLGQSSFYSPIPNQTTEEQEEPKLQQLSQATLVDFDSPTIGKITQLAVGHEHALFLTESNDIYGTGANTDGQLAMTPASDDASAADVYRWTKIALPKEIVEDGIAAIRAGADTSALITRSGKLWSWGNSVSPPSR